MSVSSVTFDALPPYLQKEFSLLHSASPPSSIQILSLPQIRQLSSSSSASSTRDRQAQYAHLLLLRHHLTEHMCQISDAAKIDCVVSPELVLQRAEVYEALAYADLAVADAYVAFSVSTGEVEDLRAIGTDGGLWEVDGGGEDDEENEDGDEADGCLSDGISDSGGGGSESDGRESERKREAIRQVKATMKRDALRIMVRTLRQLGCMRELSRWRALLQEAEEDFQIHEQSVFDEEDRRGWMIYDKHASHPLLNGAQTDRDQAKSNTAPGDSLFGLSRREIYPWNELEPADRMSGNSLKEINSRVFEASNGCLEVRKTVLPNLDCSTSNKHDESATQETLTTQENAQLGLFALRNLAPREIVLREHSVLTAIRPHDAPLCDACAADIHSSTPSSSTGSESGTMSEMQRQTYACPGCSIPFCSSTCLSTALSTYHVPNTDDETTESGYPPSASPFCPGKSAHPDIHELGRAESSEDPEWDLYFLLVARCVMMTETRSVSPLQMTEVKWLWGEFNPVPEPEPSSQLQSPNASTISETGITTKRTLPYSLHHSLFLPFEFFTTLLLSRPECAPYSSKWLRNYDWWIIQTLFAKFRGVADAKQSSWDGLPESAGVFGLWCLGNHSCGANVDWETRRGGKGRGGERIFQVREEIWRPDRTKKAEDDEAEGRDDTDPAREVGVKEWRGIKKGKEIWNHYTDTREENFRVRRGRLREVLGGDCMCERCIWEEKEYMKS